MLDKMTTEDMIATLANARKMNAHVMRIGIAYTARTGEDWHAWTIYADAARIDSMRNAEPLTRLTADVPPNACVGPFITRATHYQQGSWRIALREKGKATP